MYVYVRIYMYVNICMYIKYIYMRIYLIMHIDLKKLSNHWQTRECGQREKSRCSRFLV